MINLKVRCDMKELTKKDGAMDCFRGSGPKSQSNDYIEGYKAALRSMYSRLDSKYKNDPKMSMPND